MTVATMLSVASFIAALPGAISNGIDVIAKIRPQRAIQAGKPMTTLAFSQKYPVWHGFLTLSMFLFIALGLWFALRSKAPDTSPTAAHEQAKVIVPTPTQNPPPVKTDTPVQPQPKKSSAKRMPHIRAQQPQVNDPTPAPALPPQSADHGIINNGPNNGTQSVNDNRQYGVPKPPPKIVGISYQKVDAIPRPEFKSDTPPEERAMKTLQYNEQIRQGGGLIWNPGIQILFGVDATFMQPMFKLNCYHACVPVFLMFYSNGSAGFSGSSPFHATQDPRIWVIDTGNLHLLTPEVAVSLTIRSGDGLELTSPSVEGYVQ